MCRFVSSPHQHAQSLFPASTSASAPEDILGHVIVPCPCATSPCPPPSCLCPGCPIFPSHLHFTLMPQKLCYFLSFGSKGHFKSLTLLRNLRIHLTAACWKLLYFIITFCLDLSKLGLWFFLFLSRVAVTCRHSLKFWINEYRNLCLCYTKMCNQFREAQHMYLSLWACC